MVWVSSRTVFNHETNSAWDVGSMCFHSH